MPSHSAAPRTLYDKLWDAHVVVPETVEAPALLYVDLHLVHEVTSPQAFAELERRGLPVRRPDRTVGTTDHSTPTSPRGRDGSYRYANEATRRQVALFSANCQRHGIEAFGMGAPDRGIVHVVAPEIGLTRPGMTIVCGDSHTSTHGAFGALAFGIGTSEVAQVLATQCLLQRKARTMAVTIDGPPGPGVTAKDIILHVIGVVGTHGGVGHVIEYRGETVRALDMEQRMTLCNMSIEAGARSGMIAADATTLAWIANTPRGPKGRELEACAAEWAQWRSDEGAMFDVEVHIDARDIRPTLTWGTHPGTALAVDASVPVATSDEDQQALAYMGLESGRSLLGTPIDVAFVGSCTNGRLGDLREVARILRGRRVAKHVRMLVVPGSEAVKRAAEIEGIDRVVRAAGAEWREPGCSMCIAMNGDLAQPGQLVVSTSNRNFEGRQGPGARTVLASPSTAAWSAVCGVLSDPRQWAAAGDPA
ncbi:3-isopropylmalate dehydratase large subunit [Luteimonas composti]|uniref:3-isopropylmalate dehydratase n=1 Tax=Luteimonas composti TaxID=398257 RepID=A0ABT6MNN6_9GAMM|nr:3-isopropylmalate dehydratase large subunit [Luteimonas composti]MDH7452210.1 3-isopropylmalate dehydratase large subunit [Luteimonas composti]